MTGKIHVLPASVSTIVLIALFVFTSSIQPVTLTLASGDDASSRAGDFTISILPTPALTTGQGGNLWYLVEFKSIDSFAGVITASVTGVPSNTNLYFYPQTVDLIADGKVNTFVRINTTTTTPAGQYQLTITGTNGTTIHSMNRFFDVVSGAYMAIEATPFEQAAGPNEAVNYTLKFIDCKGYAGTNNIFTPFDSGLGASHSFTPGTSFTLKADTIHPVTVKVTPPSSPTPGVYNIMYQGVSSTPMQNWSTAVKLRAVAGNSISVSGRPFMQTIAPGDGASFTFEVKAPGTAPGTASMSLGTALPSSITGSFSPVTVNPDASGKNLTTLTVQTTTMTKAGIYPISGNASTGTVNDIDTVYLWVTETPDFAVHGSPSSRTITNTGTARYKVVIDSLKGFADDVNINIESIPSGTSATLSKSTVTLAAEDTATVDFNLTSSSASAGKYYSRLAISNETLYHTLDLELVVATTLPSDFNMSVDPVNQSAYQYKPYKYEVTLGSENSFTGAVGLSVEGVPNGTTAGFEDPRPTVPNGGTVKTNLTVTPSVATPVGNYKFRIVGQNASSVHDADVMFKMLPAPGVSVVPEAPSNYVLRGSWVEVPILILARGVDPGVIDFSGITLPAGFSGTFTPTSITGPGKVVLNLSAAPTMATGPQDIQFSAHNTTDTFPCTVHVMVQDFGLSTLEATRSALPGNNASYVINTSGVFGFGRLVSMAVEGCPSGVVVNASSNVTIPANYPLKLDIGQVVASGSYPLKVNGTYRGVFRTVDLLLNVTNFTVSFPSIVIPVLRGDTVNVSVNVLSVLGYNGTVALEKAFIGPGSGVTGIALSLANASVVSPGSTVLTIKTFDNSAFGIYSVFVNGTSGGQKRTAGINVTVQGFTVGISPAARTGHPGGTVSYDLNVTGLAGFTGPVNLSAKVSRTGTHPVLSPEVVTADGTATLSIDILPLAPEGDYGINVTATSGNISVTVATSMTVKLLILKAEPTIITVLSGENALYTISAIGTMDVGENIKLSVESAPLGAVIDIGTGYLTSDAPSLEVNVSTADIEPGNYDLVIDSTLGTEALKLYLVVQDYELNMTPVKDATHMWDDPLTIMAGERFRAVVDVQGMNGFAGVVGLELAPLPSTMMAGTLLVTQLTAGSNTTLDIMTEDGLLDGEYTIEVRSLWPGARVAKLDIKVDNTVPTFGLALNPTSMEIRPGETINITVDLTPINGFNKEVTLEVIGLTAGVTATWSSSKATPPSSVKLTLTVDGSVTQGDVLNLTVKGTRGALSVSAPFVLTINVKETPPPTDNGNRVQSNIMPFLLLVILVMVIVGVLVAVKVFMGKNRGPGEPEMRSGIDEQQQDSRPDVQEMDRSHDEGANTGGGNGFNIER